MCAKTSLFILFLFSYSMHACYARRLSYTTHHDPIKETENSLKSRVQFRSSKNEPMETCNKNNGIIDEGTKSDAFSISCSFHPFGNPLEGKDSWLLGGVDCIKPSHHRALLHYSTKSEGSRWSNVDVRGTPIFREDDFSETDYQPPHRKAPIHNK